MLSAEAPPGQASAIFWSLLAGVSGVLGLGAFYLALARGTMSVAAPLAGLVSAAVPAAVGIAAGEAVEPIRGVGLVAALASVVLISRRAGTSERPEAAREPPAPPAVRRFAAVRRPRAGLGGIPFAVLGGLGFAGFFLGVDQAHAAGAQTWWPIVGVRAAGVFIVILAAVVIGLRGHGAGRASLGLAGAFRKPVLVLFAISGLGDLGGNLFFVLANQAGSLPVAVVLSSLYPVITVLLARVVLRELLGRTQLAGVVLAMVGIGLIALGGTAG